MSTRQEFVTSFLYRLVVAYDRLDEEETFLRTGTTQRLAEIDLEKADLLAEAQELLVKFNALRAAEGKPALSLAQVRNLAKQFPTAGI
jgi:hypothetical protein